MSTTSKSPRKVALTALRVARASMSEYAHKFSPRTYTQHQLFACLVLMTFFRTDYRGIEAILKDTPDLRSLLGLRRIPDHSTLHKAAKRLLSQPATAKLIEASLKLVKTKGGVLAACDSSGLESGHRSPYFVMRRQRGQKQVKNPLYLTTHYTRFPKMALMVDCRTHMILALITGRGPGPDTQDLPVLLDKTPKRYRPKVLLADAGYDSQENHVYAREAHGAMSIIPPIKGRPTTRRLKSQHRENMKTNWDIYKRFYGQRWQVETVNSMIKRNLTHELSAASFHSQGRQTRLLAITHNIMI